MSSEPKFFDRKDQAPQDWDKLKAYLAGKGHELTIDPLPHQFTGGFGNLNFLIELDGKPAVLRRPPTGPLPPGGNDMNREHRVLSRLHAKFPLAPRAFFFGEDETVLDGLFFIMEYRPGLTVRREVPDVLKGQGEALSHMLIDVLAEFHAVDPAAVDLDTLGKPDGFLGRAVAGWNKRCAVASADVYEDGRPCAPAREIGEWLAAQTPPQGDVSLLHNDFKLDNIILDPETPTRPIAVLDWDMCTRGDPLFDLATLMSYWFRPEDPESMHAMGQMPTVAETSFLERAEVVGRYAKATGRDVSNFHFYRVLTAYKLGIIFLQIYARFCRGTTTDPRIGELGPRADDAFDFAYEVMKGRIF